MINIDNERTIGFVNVKSGITQKKFTNWKIFGKHNSVIYNVIFIQFLRKVKLKLSKCWTKPNRLKIDLRLLNDSVESGWKFIPQRRQNDFKRICSIFHIQPHVRKVSSRISWQVRCQLGVRGKFECTRIILSVSISEDHFEWKV